jgi:hypothetical protein
MTNRPEFVQKEQPVSDLTREVLLQRVNKSTLLRRVVVAKSRPPQDSFAEYIFKESFMTTAVNKNTPLWQYHRAK